MLLAIASGIDFGNPSMLIGEAIQSSSPQDVGAANIVTSVVLGYRGIDTLGELSILFAAASAAGLVLGRRHTTAGTQTRGGFVLHHGGALLFPLLLTIGFYIIFHGHLTPGGGFQGGVILAAAFFLPLLASPGARLHHSILSVIEAFAGASFILIGLAALAEGKAFLQPMLNQDTLGSLVSAGTLPLLYVAVGLKVGAELASLLSNLAQTESEQ
jgi:multicomponent Na+:H+ antiporter subunit B